MIYCDSGLMGVPITVGTAPELPEGKTEVAAETIEEAWGLMLVDGVWTPRPQLAPHNVSGLVVTFPDAPAETHLEATQGGSITAATGTTITLPGSGAYWIEALPPLPTMPVRFRLEIA